MGRTIFPIDPADLERAAAIIRSGGLVAFPTETVYGLGANALDPHAVQRIFAAKGRPSTSPLIVHVASPEMARSVVSEWPPEATILAERFWPGPLTLILPKQPHVPDQVTAGLSTVGVRVPAHPIALALIEAAGVPVAAPSANRFAQISPTEARHVREALGNQVDYILDGGSTEVGIESTVLSLAKRETMLLRPGMITRRQIEALIGPVGMRDDSAVEVHVSPGLHRKHYSPITRAILTDQLPPGRGAYLWWKREAPAEVLVRMPANPAEYAHQLYAVLHKLDSEGLDFIAIEPVPETDDWAGIRDRLSRATE
jgi:L-threonylcarbamoyladenylate synthase